MASRRPRDRLSPSFRRSISWPAPGSHRSGASHSRWTCTPVAIRHMSADSRSAISAPTASNPASDQASRRWIEHPRTGHPRRDATVAELYAVLLRSAYHELSRRRAQLGSVSGPEFDDLAQHAADDAMVKILAKLEQFAGLSRRTTCAYKFVIFEISGLVSRHARQRESPRADELVWERLADSPTTDPAQRLERSEQLAVLASAVDRLTKRLRPPGDRPLPTPQATQRHRQAPRRLRQGCRARQRQQRPMPSLRHWPRHSRRSGSRSGNCSRTLRRAPSSSGR